MTTNAPPERHRPRRRTAAALLVAAVSLAGASLATPAAAHSGQDPAPATRKVQEGETLSELAERLDTTVYALAVLNGLADPDLVIAGQTLRVPVAVPPGGSHPVPADRRHLEPAFEHWARANGFRPSLLKAMCYLESGWQPHVISSTGAEGVCQIMPDTEDFLEAKIGLELDSLDAEDNIRLGARYVRWLLHQTDWDVEETLGAYYQGLGAMREHGPYDETDRYVANVLALEKRFQ